MSNLWAWDWEDDGYDGDWLDADEKLAEKELFENQKEDEETEEI
jgi:hypothetical protein